jgi:hypothetical protein
VLGAGAASAEVPNTSVSVALFQRLSIHLRHKLLDSAEQAQLRRELARGRPVREIYERYVTRWVTPKTASNAFPYTAGGPAAVRNLFLGQMARVKVAGGWRYSLPSPETDKGPPCTDDRVVHVHPWWSVDEVIDVCADAYRPEIAFDRVGYCGGKPGSLPAPPRKDCGCGPLLLACLPPDGVADDISLGAGMVDEIAKTAAEVVGQDRPFDEIFTTSTTWQTGAVRFLYLRRELVGLLRTTPYSPALEEELQRRVRALDLRAPGKWVERDGPYRGSGLFLTTPDAASANGTYRDLVRANYDLAMCTTFTSVHVDSEALLKTVGNQHANLRALNSWDSPMQHQTGCEGCHRPMDNATAFLAGLTTPIFGSFPTGETRESSFYLAGANDLRGSSRGIDGFTKLMVSQPEFPRCAIKQAFRRLLAREPVSSDRGWIDTLTAGLEEHKRSWAWLVGAIVRSPAYTGDLP